MLIVAYDIQNDKLRTNFSKFLSKFGYRLQLSVFQVKNSKRILGNIVAGIKSDFESKFSESDSVIIFELSNTCKISRFGSAAHEEEDLIFVD